MGALDVVQKRALPSVSVRARVLLCVLADLGVAGLAALVVGGPDSRRPHRALLRLAHLGDRVGRRAGARVVPREREYRYTFNPHFNFFPYTHSFLRAMQPVPQAHVCRDIQRDIYYCETLDAADAPRMVAAE